MLACTPKGNPTPLLVCTWNGVTFDPQVLQRATQNHAGVYCCTATNQLGSVSKDIALVVRGDRGPLLPGPGWTSPGVSDSHPDLEREGFSWAGEGETGRWAWWAGVGRFSCP